MHVVRREQVRIEEFLPSCATCTRGTSFPPRLLGRPGPVVPEGVAYEDQPIVTQALRPRLSIDVLPEIVYRYRVTTETDQPADGQPEGPPRPDRGLAGSAATSSAPRSRHGSTRGGSRPCSRRTSSGTSGVPGRSTTSTGTVDPPYQPDRGRVDLGLGPHPAGSPRPDPPRAAPTAVRTPRSSSAAAASSRSSGRPPSARTASCSSSRCWGTRTDDSLFLVRPHQRGSRTLSRTCTGWTNPTAAAPVRSRMGIPAQGRPGEARRRGHRAGCATRPPERSGRSRPPAGRSRRTPHRAKTWARLLAGPVRGRYVAVLPRRGRGRRCGACGCRSRPPGSPSSTRSPTHPQRRRRCGARHHWAGRPPHRRLAPPPDAQAAGGPWQRHRLPGRPQRPRPVRAPGPRGRRPHRQGRRRRRRLRRGDRRPDRGIPRRGSQKRPTPAPGVARVWHLSAWTRDGERVDVLPEAGSRIAATSGSLVLETDRNGGLVVTEWSRGATADQIEVSADGVLSVVGRVFGPGSPAVGIATRGKRTRAYGAETPVREAGSGRASSRPTRCTASGSTRFPPATTTSPLSCVTGTVLRSRCPCWSRRSWRPPAARHRH